MQVYETKTRFFIVGSNRHKTKFRLLKLDRTDLTELSVSEDPFFYSRKQIQDLLNMIDTGNKGSGGLKKTCVAFGLVGASHQLFVLIVVTLGRFCAIPLWLLLIINNQETETGGNWRTLCVWY
jgi:hypothetical protein